MGFPGWNTFFDKQGYRWVFVWPNVSEILLFARLFQRSHMHNRHLRWRWMLYHVILLYFKGEPGTMYRFAGLRAHTEPFWAPHY